MMINDQIIANLIKECVELILKRDYQTLNERGYLGRLTASDIEEAIKSYPGNIYMPPNEAFNSFQRYDYPPSEEAICLVEINLWFDGKESDLTLSLEIIKNQGGQYLFRIDDIHVL